MILRPKSCAAVVDATAALASRVVYEGLSLMAPSGVMFKLAGWVSGRVLVLGVDTCCKYRCFSHSASDDSQDFHSNQSRTML